MTTTKRMPRERRRRQLLDVAMDLVRREGTDAVTLARVAEAAGVTKPVTYGHFGTRAGLLAALYHDYEERQNEVMRAVLAARGGSLEGVAEIVAASYVDCLLGSGPECEEVAAALAAFEETKDFLQKSRDDFVMECRKAFGPFVVLPEPRGQALLTGLLGSIEALAQAAASQRLPRDEAVAALREMIASVLAPYAEAKARERR